MSAAASRGSVAGAALVLTFVAVFAQVVAPGPALACSCITPLPTLAEVALEPNTAVIAGTIGPQQPERTPVQVDTWFRGDAPAPVVWLSFGSQMTTSCDPIVNVGERRLLVIHRVEADLYSVNPCVEPTGVIGTPQGDTALATAHELFGAEQPSPTAQATPPPETVAPEPAPADSGWLYVAAVVGGALLIFAVVGLLALRRRPSG